MTEKLGPCPLCGGLSRNNSTEAWCRDANCISRSGNVFTLDAWNRLSAMAANEKRMREALERCRSLSVERAMGEHACPHTAWLDQITVVCEKALKGGKQG